MTTQRRIQLLISLSMMSLIQTGCQTNSFLRQYEGNRYPPVDAAVIVSERPAGSGLIGFAIFKSLRDENDADAIAAAKAVGAHYVEWTREKAGTRTVREGEYYTVPMLVFDTHSASKHGPNTTEVDVPVAFRHRTRVLQQYAYSARFYRAAQ